MSADLLANADDLDRAAILAVARGRGVQLDPALRSRLTARRHDLLAALSTGAPVYGVNTGMGARSDVRLTEQEQAVHQNDLLLARAVGGPPWLSRVEVRALLAVRLRTFLSGDAGVSVSLIDALIGLLADDVVPAVPRSAYGGAGEIIPLAHAFGPLIGIGAVCDGESTASAADSLRTSGRVPISLGPKEGIALLQGVPGATGRAILLADRVSRLLDQAITVFALSLAAVAAPRDPYLAPVARGDDTHAAVSARIRALLEGTDDRPRVLQAATSFRVAAVVFAHVVRTHAALGAAIDRALSGVTDSPVLIGDDFRGTAGFHGIDLAAHLDQLVVALVHAAEVSTARTHRMLDSRFTGLPPQLATAPGATGLVAVHKRAVGSIHELRRATLSSVAGTADTSFGQEDVQAFTWEAAGAVHTAVDGLTDVLACELLVATHARRLGGRPVGAPLQSAVDTVDTVVPVIEADRTFGSDVEVLRRLLAADGLSRSARTA